MLRVGGGPGPKAALGLAESDADALPVSRTPSSRSPSSRTGSSSAGATLTSSTVRSPSARARTSGASTRARRPRTAGPAPITSSRASSRTSTRATARCAATGCRARPAGTATACPVELEVERELGIKEKDEIEAYGIAEFNQRCRESVFRYVDDWARLTERIGFWIDLDDAYVTLRNEYIESVWWSLRKIWDDGRLYQGHKVVPYCPRCGTALSSHEVAQGYQDVEDPSVYVKLPVPGPAVASVEPGDKLLVWTTTPWTLISNAAVAVGPEIEYARVRPQGADEVFVVAKRLVERVFGEGAEVLATFPGTALAGTALRAAVRLHHRLRAARPHRPRGRLRLHRGRHGPRPHRDRVRRGRLPPRRAVRDHAPEPGAPGRHLRRAGHRLRRPQGQGGRPRHHRGAAGERPPAAAPRSTSTPTRTAGAAARRSSTTRSRAGTSAPPTSATGCSPRTRRSAGTPSTSSTGASASGWRETRTGRSPGSATGGRRCRSGSAVGRLRGALLRGIDRRTCATGAAPSPTTSTAPTSTRSTLRCEACGGEMRRVVETIDAWYDSGSMPFAQFHYPFEGEASVRRALPGRLHQRGHRPDPRLVLLAARRSRPCSSTRRATATASASG